jgi:hypothetical protein
MKKITYAVALVMSLSGCAASRDGIRLGGGPNDSDIARVRNQIAENAQKSAAKRAVTEALKPETKPGIIVIGETGVLHELEAAKSKKNYREFVDVASKWHPGIAPYWSEDEYIRQIGGWTTLEVYSIPGIVAFKLPTAVPKSQMASINFASIAGAWLMNSTKDLVASRSNDDGISVIEKVLCVSSSDDYKACAAQYIRGQFDAVSGIELDRSAQIKADGTRIDTATFKKI